MAQPAPGTPFFIFAHVFQRAYRRSRPNLRPHPHGFLSVPALLLVFLAIFLAIGNSRASAIPGTTTGQTIIMRGVTQDLDRPYMVRALARYKKQTGNTVRLEKFTHEALNQNLIDTYIHGTVERPDLLYTYGGFNLDRFSPEINFYDFTTAPWVDDVTDTALSQAVYQSRVYGLPFGELAFSGMLYNKRLFARYGIAVPRTQQEFLNACATLQQNGVIPVYIPGAEPSMMLYQLPLDSVVNTPRVLEQLNAGTLRYQDMAEMRAIVQWYKSMAERGHFGNDYMENNWHGMDRALKSRQYAMMICWDTWLYTNFTGDPHEFGLMPAFMGVPKKGTFGGPNLALLVVDKKSPNLAVVQDFITFMATPDTYNDAFSGLYTAPAFRSQTGNFTSPQYIEGERSIERLMYASTAWRRILGFSQLDSVYIQKYMRNSNYSLDECLKDMDKARIKRAQLPQ